MRKTILTPLLVTATVGMASLAPIAAHADSLQKQKNNWRNIAIGAGAIGVYGLMNHNNTATLLGALGAAYAGSQYESKRHQQSQQNNGWRNYYRGRSHYYRHHYR
jgi:hypothetical protein